MNDILSNMQDSYSKDTCHHSYQHLWSAENPSAGHCAIASLLLAKYCGYDVYKVKVGKGTHYYNVNKDGIIIDATSNQFPFAIDYSNGVKCSIKSMLRVADTVMRMSLLEERAMLQKKKFQ